MTTPALDVRDCAALLAAVARQWADDARGDEGELASLAGWLHMPPDELRRRLKERHCRTCGAVLPERQTKRGRRLLYCSKSCSQRAAAIRSAKIDVPI